ncbi:MAG TPA: capsule assembly Wzi family protein [Longimicrobiaceae bacterium]|nr:capsule assembly Wzi family protein [Longimicrobiaceae bacterium]
MTGELRSARALALAVLLLPAALRAQAPDSLPAGTTVAPLPSLGSLPEDRARVRQLFGRAPAEGWLIRSPSSLDAAPRGGGLRWSLIPPETELAWNSAIPFSLNDGAMWAGRGLSAQVTAGVRVSAGPVSLVLAPQLVHSENRDFDAVPQDSLGRSVFFPPWYLGETTVDLPFRFGDRPLTRLVPGQSSLTLTAGPAAFGAATENQWWGPGIRNAIVMSDHAEGVPHLFLRTAAPLRTPVGSFEGKWIVGGLAESLYFDTDPENDFRSLSGVAATFRPAPIPDLTVGVARVVYMSTTGASAVPRRSLDVFRHWGRPEPVRTPVPGAPDSTAVTLEGPGFDQILSVFGRMLFPRSGLEVYGEWARLELPSSFVELLNQPGHSQGFTLGTQWARPLSGERYFRLQAELSYLEEGTTFNNRAVPWFYVGPTVPQGYTHRGQVVGAAIGPGASSQWLAGDYLGRGWQLGAFGGRIRWENNVYYTDFAEFAEVGHDVSVLAGVRGAFRAWGATFSAEVAHELRYNYLFQGPPGNPFGNGATDVDNMVVRIGVVPAR